MPEPSENWLTVGGWVGAFLAAVILGFVKFYGNEREKARGEIERSPEVAAKAVGAAFVDRAAAQAIVSTAEVVKDVAEDVHAILELVRERSQQDHDDRIQKKALDDDRLRERLERIERARGDRG